MNGKPTGLPARSGWILGSVLIAVLPVGPGRFEVSAITLTGANGRKVEFAGIKEARPEGITAKVDPEASLIGITWKKLDIEALEQEHPVIYRAYEASREGETIPLDLGIFAPEDEKMAESGEGDGSDGSKPKPKPKDRYPGWEDVRVGGTTFAMQLPAGKVEGILLVAVGDDGFSFRYLRGHEQGRGRWGDFQNDYRFALLTYEYDDGNYDPAKIDEFAFAEKGSGEDVLAAVDRIAEQTGRKELSDAPFAVHGADRVGACFAYHFALWKPERVIAAVASKGAFYQAEPSEAAAKTPLLFIWGEYSNKPELWNSERTARKVLTEYSAMTPNWTAGRQYRAGGDQGPVTEHFGREYLKEMIELRLPEDKPAPEAEEETDGGAESGDAESDGPADGDADSPAEAESGDDSSDGEGGEEGEEEKEKNAEPAKPALVELDRSEGYAGNLETGETSSIDDPSTPLGEDETFLPTKDVASMWKDFVQGQLQPPPRGE